MVPKRKSGSGAPKKTFARKNKLIRSKTSKSLFFLAKVFLGAPEPDFLFGTIPVAIMLPIFLVDNLPFLRHQHLRSQEDKTKDKVLLLKMNK